MRRYGGRSSKGGWYGDSSGHSLAARGVRLYSTKQRLMDPVFAARKREEELSSYEVIQLIKDGKTYSEIKQMKPDVDHESVRLRSIKALDGYSGSNTLSSLNSNGVDAIVRMAKVNAGFKNRALEALNDHQKSSFLPELKVQILKKRLGDVV